MKQRLGIAMALIKNPKLLILDEPTNGLDPGGTQEIRDLLLKLSHKEGITIMISTHLLDKIEKIADDVGILDKGKLIYQVPLEELERFKTNKTELKTSDNIKSLELLGTLKPVIKNKKNSKRSQCKEKSSSNKISSRFRNRGL